MRGDLMITGPRGASAQVMKDFIALYEPLAARDDGVAAEVEITRVRLAIAEAQDVVSTASKAA
jgi:hypothetical protein